nr:MAG TPA: hypothetical protein [Caudoviricetes sp.]DAW88600.1 MAG TPA: hypothetical protein [Caudoviricetes sp.]
MSAGDTRYPSNDIYLHPVKDKFGSTFALSTHFSCNRLKSQHGQKTLMTKQPWAGRCNHHTQS